MTIWNIDAYIYIYIYIHLKWKISEQQYFQVVNIMYTRYMTQLDNTPVNQQIHNKTSGVFTHIVDKKGRNTSN